VECAELEDGLLTLRFDRSGPPQNAPVTTGSADAAG
jgi:hypothetical protein